jgi:hypothetical protein
MDGQPDSAYPVFSFRHTPRTAFRPVRHSRPTVPGGLPAVAGELPG